MNQHQLLSELKTLRAHLNTLIAHLEPSHHPDLHQAIQDACLKVGMPNKASVIAAEYQKTHPTLSMRKAAFILRALGYQHHRKADGQHWR